MPATKTKKAAKTTGPKKAAKAPAPAPVPKKLSALDAASRVLAETGGSMTTQELIEAMAGQKLWTSPNGRTPAATLYAAILRELTTKGTASRFQKTAPGRFAATGATAKAIPPKAAKGAKKKSVGKKTQPAAPEASVPDGPTGAGAVPAA